MFICYFHDTHKATVGIHDNQNTHYVVLWVTIFEVMESPISAARILNLPFDQLPNLPKPVIPDVKLNVDNIQLTPSVGYVTNI